MSSRVSRKIFTFVVYMTTELKNKITLSNSYIDESFDVKKAVNYHLVLQVGLDSVVAVVLDKVQKKYVALEKHAFQNVHSFKLIPDLLDILFKSRKIFPNKYKSVTCVVVDKLSTLVPNPLYADTNKKQYLNFNALLEDSDEVMVDELKSLDAKNVFAISSDLKSKINTLYTSVKYQHASSSLIESLLLKNKNSSKSKLYVHVQDSHFEVLMVEGKKLNFYNTFNHHAAEDFIYYLLFTCEQLQLNPETVEVVLIGEIEKKSALYATAHKYIRNLKFGARKIDADLSYQLQDIPKHYYYTLFSNYLL